MSKPTLSENAAVALINMIERNWPKYRDIAESIAMVTGCDKLEETLERSHEQYIVAQNKIAQLEADGEALRKACRESYDKLKLWAKNHDSRCTCAICVEIYRLKEALAAHKEGK